MYPSRITDGDDSIGNILWIQVEVVNASVPV